MKQENNDSSNCLTRLKESRNSTNIALSLYGDLSPGIWFFKLLISSCSLLAASLCLSRSSFSRAWNLLIVFSFSSIICRNAEMVALKASWLGPLSVFSDLSTLDNTTAKVFGFFSSKSFSRAAFFDRYSISWDSHLDSATDRSEAKVRAWPSCSWRRIIFLAENEFVSIKR